MRKTGEASTKTTRTAAFVPVFPDRGRMRPMIYPGPASNVTAEIGVTKANRGQDIVKQPFSRYVIMAGNAGQ